MTLAQIIRMALRQLDEDPEDISEYDDLFRAYANEGYAIAVDGYWRPRQMRRLYTDEQGLAPIEGMDIRRIVRVWARRGEGLVSARFALTPDGRAIRTAHRQEELHAMCEIDMPPLTQDGDEPGLPEHAHAALADYICYRHLANGNLAKQKRAQVYYRHFLERMRGLRPDGYGSVTAFTGLYEATGLRRF